MFCILSRSQLRSASVLRRFLLEDVRSFRAPRPVVRAALVACLAELDPEGYFDFRIRLDSGKSVHGVVRLVTSPCPDIDCSDTDNTPF